MSSAIHFYLTFNPHLNKAMEGGNTQAHEFYDYLVGNIKKDKNGYAYWGKIIGENRESKLDIEKLKTILADNNDKGVSTHLYISDFKNLWVGKVEEIKKTIGKDFKTLDFYKDKKVEVWFKLTDFFMLEHESESTARKLSELYIHNKYENLEIDELSPFTTGIKYPTFVQDLAEEYYFDEKDDEISHLALEYNAGVNNTLISNVIRNLYTYAIPEHLYNRLPHSAKAEIEAAEIDMFENRHHNLAKIAFSYIKVMEIILNDLIIHHVKRSGYGNEFFVAYESMPPKLYFEDNKPGLIPISKFQKNYSCTQLFYFVQRGLKSDNFCFKKAFSGKSQFLKYVANDLPKILEENQILHMRGVLAHNDSLSIEQKDCLAVRNLVLGVGCKGIIHSLYQRFSPDDFRPMIEVRGYYNNKVKKGDNSNYKGKKKAA